MIFRHKTVVVTGAARGLGRAFALAFAAEGGRLVVVDRANPTDVLDDIKGRGGEAISVLADVSSEEGASDIAAKALEAFGTIDILINNAGIYEIVPFADLTFGDWRRTMAVNVDGAFLCTKAVLPAMKRQGNGRIINISSGTVWAGGPPFAHYITSKGAIIALTRSTSSELASFGITVNCVAPGLMQTDGVANMMRKISKDDLWPQVLSTQSIQRKGTPEDVVGAALYFASPGASFVTGQTLCVDGGLVKH